MILDKISNVCENWSWVLDLWLDKTFEPKWLKSNFQVPDPNKVQKFLKFDGLI